MTKILITALTALIALSGAACSTDDGGAPGGADGGSGGAASADNLAACRAYVTTMNELSCVPDAAMLDAATACPGALNDLGCDVSDYYDCLTTNLMCMDVGGTSVLDSSGATSCGTGPVCT